METLHTFRVLNFVCIYFYELAKIVFCKYLSLQMTSFWKFRLCKFQPQREKNKKKTVESRDIWLMFLSRSPEMQAGHGWKKCYWLILKKPELTNIFYAYFFCVFIFWKYEFCAYFTCICFHECCLKENFTCI